MLEHFIVILPFPRAVNYECDPQHSPVKIPPAIKGTEQAQSSGKSIGFRISSVSKLYFCSLAIFQAPWYL